MSKYSKPRSYTVAADYAGRYRVRPADRPEGSAEYIYTVHETIRDGMPTIIYRFIGAKGSFGDPCDMDLITAVRNFHRSYRAQSSRPVLKVAA